MEKQSVKISNFTDLKVWQEGHQLCLLIYKITEDFPKHELFGLISQLRRAAVSITSNIAEGFSRWSYKEKIQFYYIAHGSVTEVENQLILARDLKYLKAIDYEFVLKKLISTHKLLNIFIKSTRSY